MSKNDCYTWLVENARYPEHVVKDMCNYYNTQELLDYIEFLKEEM